MTLYRTYSPKSARVAVWTVVVNRGVPSWSAVELGPPGDSHYRNDLPTLRGSTRVFTPEDAELVSGLRYPAAWDWVLENAGEWHAPHA